MNSIKKAGVIGFPVAHSLSPRLHNYWLKKYNIKGEYKAYPVESENLGKFIGKLRIDKDFAGVNLTIPHKQAVIEFLDEVDDISRKIGAVNTVISENGKLIGINTDAYGFANNIGLEFPDNKKAVIIGAGGAAKAVLYVIGNLEFDEIIIVNRTRKKAEELAEESGFKVKVEDWEERGEVLKDVDLLVNTTSLGLVGNPPLEIDLSSLPKEALVTDIVYTPLITPFLEKASKRGNQVIDGLGMLLYQAVPAFEAWFGIRPEVDDELRQYLLSQR
ncbi:MAG: shikimate dehydrogenase [Rickettsiales bacterium]